MLASKVPANSAPRITGDLSDPVAEITAWCHVLLAHLREHAHIIRKTIAEAEERPDAACAACEGSNSASESLFLYVERLRNAGFAEPDTDVGTAVSMFMSAMFGDALYRDIIPRAFPQPVEDAPAKYVQTFLRAVGVRALLPDRSRQVK